MNLQERALEAYQEYGAKRLERLKDPTHTMSALERILGIIDGVSLFRDDQGIVIAQVEDVYFYYVDDKLHTLLRMSGQAAPTWNPCEDLVALGRVLMMRDQGQLELMTPPQLNPI